MSDIQHIGGRTPDLTEENVDKLVALFPDVLTEVTDQQTGKAESGDYDDDGGPLVVNPESNGRFHSDWCSMIYPRLLLARDLLASDGVIFISIDENESANLKKICDEVFGNECFVNKVIWRSSDNSNNDAKQFSNDYNDILIYSKKPGWQPNRLQDPEKRRHFKNPDNDPRGAWFDGDPLNSPNYRENLRYEIVAPNGNIIRPPADGWRWSKETLDQKMKSGEIYFNEKQTNIKRRTYLADMKGLPPSSLWTDLDQTGHNRQAKYELLQLIDDDVFDTPKPVKLLSFILSLIPSSENSIVLDFFGGSSTTADAVMRQNAVDGQSRSYILVQIPENNQLRVPETIVKKASKALSGSAIQQIIPMSYRLLVRNAFAVPGKRSRPRLRPRMPKASLMAN